MYGKRNVTFLFLFFILRMELLFKEVGENWEEQG